MRNEETMLIDRCLPDFDVTEVHDIEVDAPPEVAYAAIRKADLRDPVISALFAVRELPNRVARRLRGDPPPAAPKSFTFQDVDAAALGWVLLGESLDKEKELEFVVGSVGRFWKRDYGWRPIPPNEFATFSEPGFAKIGLSFSVRPLGFDRSILRYEARTATTDDTARKRFRRYWMIIRPGVSIVMRRALARIKAEAERRQRAPSRRS